MKLFLITAFFTIIPYAALAQVGSTPFIVCDGVFPDECDFNDVIQLIRNVVDYLIVFSTVLASITFTYAGFEYLTSQGDTGQMKKAKKMFTMTAIGFAIVLSAWLIVNTIMRALLKSQYVFN